VLANSGSYGIYAEMIRDERPRHRHRVRSHGMPFTTKAAAPEEPGEYCFPPSAAHITGAAQLMLAFLEHTVEEAGGTWMFCDTEPECQDCSNRSGAKLGRRLRNQKPARITADHW
jgi:hypothetical protein